MDAMETEELFTWTIAPQLRTVPGVIEVTSFGGRAKQYQVKLDPGRMNAAGITTLTVSSNLTDGIDLNNPSFAVGRKPAPRWEVSSPGETKHRRQRRNIRRRCD